jgi:hypothetical protein
MKSGELTRTRRTTKDDVRVSRLSFSFFAPRLP